MQNKDQKYSTVVFSNINRLIDNQNEASLKKYKSLCKRAGSLLRTVGLMQFYAFLQAKATKDAEIHHQYLLEHLQQELHQQGIIKSQNIADLAKKIRGANLTNYMLITRETLRFLQWHKRIADTLIEGHANDEGGA